MARATSRCGTRRSPSTFAVRARTTLLACLTLDRQGLHERAVVVRRGVQVPAVRARIALASLSRQTARVLLDVQALEGLRSVCARLEPALTRSRRLLPAKGAPRLDTADLTSRSATRSRGPAPPSSSSRRASPSRSSTQRVPMRRRARRLASCSSPSSRRSACGATRYVGRQLSLLLAIFVASGCHLAVVELTTADRPVAPHQRQS